MATAIKLLALLATMSRINPAIFAPVTRWPQSPSAGPGLLIQDLPEPVLRASASRMPEITAGVAGVHLLTTAAVAAQHQGRRLETVLAEDVEDWCSAPTTPIPWPKRVPVPQWVRATRDDPWCERDMFYSAAAAMAGLATHVEDEPTRCAVQRLSERLLERADLPRAA
ncbi:MAG TPA: hypothetical protein VES01_10735 [Dermatophilaceae bacterium]|nr:hypothetical protein [Dermatophilaceae bacterium]